LLVVDLVRSQQQVTPLFFSGHTPEMIIPRLCHETWQVAVVDFDAVMTDNSGPGRDRRQFSSERLVI
jgi:hypothetical protein